MAIVVFFDLPGESPEKYDQALAEAPDPRSQPGRSHHVCFKTDAGWGVVDVWDSEESFAKFGETLGPILEKLGLQADPKIHPVHNTM